MVNGRAIRSSAAIRQERLRRIRQLKKATRPRIKRAQKRIRRGSSNIARVFDPMARWIRLGEIFEGIKGGFRGYALENLQEGNPDPELDTTDFDSFFSDDFRNVIKQDRKKSKGVFSGF